MKNLLFPLALAILGSAGASPLVLTNPISVTGAGHWEWSWPFEGGLQFGGNGNDGINSVGFYFISGEPGMGGAIFPSSTTTLNGYHSTMCCGSVAAINDLRSSRFDITIGNGGGLLTLLDEATATIVIASAALVSWIHMENTMELPGIRRGDIVITPDIPTSPDVPPTHAPEPGTAVLAFMGLGLLAIGLKCRVG